MLALQSGSVVWTTAELEIFDGFTTAQFNGSAVRMDIASVMAELVTWATSTFIGTWSWSWAREVATGGAIITLSVDSGTFTLEATNADAQTGYGLAAGASIAAASLTFDSVAAGSWAPASRMIVSKNLKVLGSGDACGDGAIRPGVPGLAHNMPAASAMGTAIDAGRLAEQLADASSPRRASVYQLHTATWLELAVGNVTRNARGILHYQFGIDAAGEAI